MKTPFWVTLFEQQGERYWHVTTKELKHCHCGPISHGEAADYWCARCTGLVTFSDDAADYIQTIIN